MNRLTRDGTADEPVSRDQILRHAGGQGNVNFPCSADHEQDWHPYPVDPYSAIYDDHAYIHEYVRWALRLTSRGGFDHPKSRVFVVFAPVIAKSFPVMSGKILRASKVCSSGSAGARSRQSTERSGCSAVPPESSGSCARPDVPQRRRDNGS